MSIFRDFGKAAGGNAAPVTTALVVAIVGTFLLIWLKAMPLSMLDDLAFNTQAALVKPWTFLTYPFVTGAMTGTIGVLFICMWLWWVGGAVERDLGSAKYLVVWFVISVLCALGVLLGVLVLQLPGN